MSKEAPSDTYIFLTHLSCDAASKQQGVTSPSWVGSPPLLPPAHAVAASPPASQPAMDTSAPAGTAPASTPELARPPPGLREGPADPTLPSQSPSHAASDRCAGPQLGAGLPTPLREPAPAVPEASCAASGIGRGIPSEASREHGLPKPPLFEPPESAAAGPTVFRVAKPDGSDAAPNNEDWVALLGGGGGEDLASTLSDLDAAPVVREEVSSATGRSTSPQQLWPSSGIPFRSGPSAAPLPASDSLQLGGFIPLSPHPAALPSLTSGVPPSERPATFDALVDVSGTAIAGKPPAELPPPGPAVVLGPAAGPEPAVATAQGPVQRRRKKMRKGSGGEDYSAWQYGAFLRALDDLHWSRDLAAKVLRSVQEAPVAAKTQLLSELYLLRWSRDGLSGIKPKDRPSFIFNIIDRESSVGRTPSELPAQVQLERLFGDDPSNRRTLHPSHLSEEVMPSFPELKGAFTVLLKQLGTLICQSMHKCCWTQMKRISKVSFALLLSKLLVKTCQL